LYAETSAKTGENVTYVFEHMVHRIYGKIKSKEINLDDPQNGIKIGNLSEEQQVT
jgi:Ras-related protein Rab-2A